MDIDFKNTEHNFFHDNKVQRLSTVLTKEKIKRNNSMTDKEREIMTMNGIEIDHNGMVITKKFDPFENVFIHRHLKFCKLPAHLQNKLAEEKASRKFATQKHFTVESLL